MDAAAEPTGHPQLRRDRPLLFSQPVFPRAERHPVRDRHRRARLCHRRADGNARRKTGAAAVPGTAPRADRSRAEADRVKSEPSFRDAPLGAGPESILPRWLLVWTAPYGIALSQN